MKKHSHINTIQTKETATEIEWDIVNNPPKVEIEVETADMIKGSFFKETITPTLSSLGSKILIGLKKPLTSLKYLFYKKFSELDLNIAPKLEIKSIPWIKIGLVVFAGYILLKKDMRFNFNLSAPFSAVADDTDNGYENTNFAQTISNPYAPVSAGSLSKDDVKVFINRYTPIAKKEMELFKIPVSIKIGQALIESRVGTSRLARNNNNFFGMKCFSKSCKKGHCSNATDDHHKDFFRKYSSVSESFRAHSILLSGARYKALKKYGNDYRKWAIGLKKQGYATDKKYAEKLINTIEKYKLYKFDNL